MGVYPGLSGWSLNALTCALIRETEGDMTTEEDEKNNRTIETEIGVTQAQVKKCHILP